MFRRAGYKVLLLNEHRTSSTCPHCHGDLETFKRRENPKPWKRNRVIVHGLLRCQSEECQQRCGYRQRYWDRDDAATLNMLDLVFWKMEGRPGRPPWLDYRQQQA